MISLGWVLIVVGALINFLAKPVMERIMKKDAEQNLLYVVKTTGMCLVILGAVMIFIAGGKVDVGAIR